jgi:hypothetical protein
LDSLRASGVEARAVKILGAAKRANLEEVYNTYYRGAAHPSITSLNRHLKVNANEEVEGLHWGPNAADVADTMNNSCTAAIYLAAYAQRLVQKHGVFDGLDQCWDRYKALVEGTKPG